MEIRAVGSTTHHDRHGHKLTKEDLEILADKFASDRKPPLTEEHDLMLPPAGQWLRATVEPTDDGEYQLVIIGEVFEQEERILTSRWNLSSETNKLTTYTPIWRYKRKTGATTIRNYDPL